MEREFEVLDRFTNQSELSERAKQRSFIQVSGAPWTVPTQHQSSGAVPRQQRQRVRVAWSRWATATAICGSTTWERRLRRFPLDHQGWHFGGEGDAWVTIIIR